MKTSSFSTLPLAPALLSNLDSLGYHEMTTIQAQSLPVILERRDLIAQAKTGSGKTAAFGIGILHKLNPSYFAIQALVLCPTRELADQVIKSCGDWRACRQRQDPDLVRRHADGPQIGSLGMARISSSPPTHPRPYRPRQINLGTVRRWCWMKPTAWSRAGFYEEISASSALARRAARPAGRHYPDDIRKPAPNSCAMRSSQVEAQHDTGRIEQRFYEVSYEAECS